MNISHVARVRLLYKTILRLHRGKEAPIRNWFKSIEWSRLIHFIRAEIGLPAELQPLGNEYVRDEFQRHKKCNEAEANLFMVEWTNYAVQLSQQLGLGIKGKPADAVGQYLQVEDLDKFTESQIIQLYELMRAATQAEHDANVAKAEASTDTEPKNPNKKS